jgi:uncharacterized protein (TIGR02246 family)
MACPTCRELRSITGQYNDQMKQLLVIFFSAAAILVAQTHAGPGDEAAIREVVRKYVDARESIDAKAIEALFTADADQLVSSGEWRKGLKEVVKGTVASSQNSRGKRTIMVESVRMLSPDVALVDGRYEISGASAEDTRKMWTALVLARSAAGWRIAAIRNMLPAR